jgi:hypothetical protein
MEALRSIGAPLFQRAAHLRTQRFIEIGLRPIAVLESGRGQHLPDQRIAKFMASQRHAPSAPGDRAAETLHVIGLYTHWIALMLFPTRN